MKQYNYKKNLLKQVKKYILSHYTLSAYNTNLELKEQIINDLSVSPEYIKLYNIDKEDAEEKLAHNWELLSQARELLNHGDKDVLAIGPLACHRMIITYLLPGIISDAVDSFD